MKNCLDVKLNVKPVFIQFAHKYYFEGPCRMTGGDGLKPGFDQMLNGMVMQGNMEAIEAYMPECANVMEPAVIEATEDWDIKDSYFETLLADREQVDFYLIGETFGADRITMEFVEKCHRPVCLMPGPWAAPRTGMFQNLNAEVHFALDWEELAMKINVLRARKALKVANLLLVTRFNANMAYAGGTCGYRDLSQVTDKFGVHFRTVNMHEIVDMMKPLTPEGNYTTPGRQTLNITEEEIAELEKMADELTAGAEEVEIEREYLMNSLIAWKVIRKQMDEYDCSGVAIPCPDVCSTRRMNQEKFTFCLNHSLNLEQGIPSACEYDIASALTMLVEIAITGKAPYMANTMPVPVNNGEKMWPHFVTDEEKEAVKDLDNLFVLYHATVHRKFNGINEEADPYAIRHFAYDQGFGAVMRHDFDKNIGQTITLAKLDGNLKTMTIVKGTIEKGIGYKAMNCNGGFFFSVSDQSKYAYAQMNAGVHQPLIFGDYTKELTFLAEILGLEAVVI